jgi:hypothetical protein
VSSPPVWLLYLPHLALPLGLATSSESFCALKTLYKKYKPVFYDYLKPLSGLLFGEGGGN